MASQETGEYDLPMYTTSNPTSTNYVFTGIKTIECASTVPSDCTDSPSVSPLSFYQEPIYEPIPLRFSKQQVKSPYESFSASHNEQYLTILNDNASGSLHEIQTMRSSNHFVPNSIASSSHALPTFTSVDSSMYYNDWSKHNGVTLKQTPGNGFWQSDSESYYQSKNSLQYAMKLSFQNQLMSAANVSDNTNHSSSFDADDEKKPLKTLSAYNFFFRHERERILAGDEGNEDEDYSFSKKQSLLFDHWYRDRTQKRSHRKSHGKVSFATLSRIVAQRWKVLPDERKTFYQDLAAEDLKRYRHELLQRETGGNAPHISSLKFRPVAQGKDIMFKASSFFDFLPITESR